MICPKEHQRGSEIKTLKEVLGLPVVYTWKPTFRILPTRVEMVDGSEQWVICKHLYRKYVPNNRGHDSYYRYRLPKDHFVLELKGID